MKSALKVLVLVMFIAIFTTAAYASGRMEEAISSTFSAAEEQQAKIDAQNVNNGSAPAAQTGTAAQTGNAAQPAQNTNKTAGKQAQQSSSAGKLYTVLPAGTDGTAGKNEKYVLFGEYPQTIMAEGVTVDKTKKRQAGAFTYYLGSDGAWYYEGEEHSYDYFEEGDAYLGIECLYSDGSERTIYDWDEPTTRFFKVEPIKWRVLTENYQGKMLLLPEVILMDGVPYNEAERADQYPNNYSTSTIRAYLNGTSYSSFVMTGLTNDGPVFTETGYDEYTGNGFLQTAFTAEEQKSIALTNVDNSLEQCFEPGEEIPEILIENREGLSLDNPNCQDKIFLLSVAEVAKYMTEEEIGGIDATDFALSEGAFYYSSWWLRSPCWAYYAYWSDEYELQYDTMRKIVYSSLGMEDSFWQDDVSGYNYNDNCVVPALCISK